METVIFEFVGIHGVSCMCFHKTLQIPEFLKGRSKNTAKYSISDMLCCESVANNGVFATLASLGFAKTSKIQRFWLVFRASRRQNIVNNVVVLFLVRAKN